MTHHHAFWPQRNHKLAKQDVWYIFMCEQGISTVLKTRYPDLKEVEHLWLTGYHLENQLPIFMRPYNMDAFDTEMPTI